MKTIEGKVGRNFSILALVAVVLLALIACEGPVGPEGPQGEPGKDGNAGTIDGVLTIGDNGNWFIDGTDTGIEAQGPAGKDGDAGTIDGIISIGENGNWFINGVDTEIPARGDDGLSLEIQIKDGTWWINGVDTEIPATGGSGDDGLTPYIDEETGTWWIGDIDTEIPAMGETGPQGPAGADTIINIDVEAGAAGGDIKTAIETAIAQALEADSGANDGSTAEKVLTVKVSGYDVADDAAMKILFIALEDYYVNLDLSGLDGRMWRDNPLLVSVDVSKVLSLVLPDTVTTVPDSAYTYSNNTTTSPFRYFTGLKSVKAENLAAIGNYAFHGHNTLESADFPSVTSVGVSAFSNTGLTTLPEGLTSIGNNAFSGCYNLTQITLPEGLVSIGEAVFNSCENLIFVTCPAQTPPMLGGSAFSYTHNNLVIKVPAGSVAAYKAAPGWSTYADRISATGELTFMEEMTEAIRSLPGGASASDPANFTPVIDLGDVSQETGAWQQLLSAVELAGKYVSLDLSACTVDGTEFTPNWHFGGRPYDGNDKIVKLTLPAGITTIGDMAFNRFTGLERVSSTTVTSIGRQAFIECTALVTANFPAVTDISDYAFYGCTALESVTLPAATTVGGLAFFRCTNLETFTLTGAGSLSVIEGGRALVRDGTELVAYPSASGSVTLPAGITSIGNGAFSNTGLEHISGPSVTGIGQDAFNSCTVLESVDFPAVTSVGITALGYCTGLTEITLSAALTDIGSYAFVNCANLILVTCHAETPPSLGSYAFSNIANLQIKVPEGSVDDYTAADGWSSYAGRISAIE